MKKYIFILTLISAILCSCGSTKKSTSRSSNSTVSKGRKVTMSTNKEINSIINIANGYKGTRYKYGGTTKKGMDCSGLVYTSFKKKDIMLPRTSRGMANVGTKVPIQKVEIGDLLFFKTGKNRNRINHVGIVVTIGSQIEFIHTSVSKGVIVSNLNERYWNANFVGVRRVL